MLYDVICRQCGQSIDHRCDSHLPTAAHDLFSWCYEPDDDLASVMKSHGATDEDLTAPFLSGAFLYPLLGKEDARTLVYSINALIRAAGLDPKALRDEALLELEDAKAWEAERIQQRIKRDEDRIAYLDSLKEDELDLLKRSLEEGASANMSLNAEFRQNFNQVPPYFAEKWLAVRKK